MNDRSAASFIHPSIHSTKQQYIFLYWRCCRKLQKPNRSLFSIPILASSDAWNGLHLVLPESQFNLQSNRILFIEAILNWTEPNRTATISESAIEYNSYFLAQRCLIAWFATMQNCCFGCIDVQSVYWFRYCDSNHWLVCLFCCRQNSL